MDHLTIGTDSQCIHLLLLNSAGNFEIMHRVQLLQDALGKAILISKEATQRIEEFQVQLSILQRQCSSRDRPLCDTLRLRSFEENGILNILTRVNTRTHKSKNETEKSICKLMRYTQCVLIIKSVSMLSILFADARRSKFIANAKFGRIPFE